MRPASKSCIAGPSPRYGTCVTSTPMATFEQRAGEMRSGAGARRAILHLGLVCLRVSDEVRQIARRDADARRQDQRLLARPALPARNRWRRHRAEFLCSKLHLRVRRFAAEQKLITVGIGPGDTRTRQSCRRPRARSRPRLAGPEFADRACGIDAPQCVVHAAGANGTTMVTGRVGQSCAPHRYARGQE